MYFLPSRVYVASHTFWNVVVLLSFVSRYFIMSLEISFLTHWFLNSVLFNFHVIMNFLLLLQLTANFIPLWWENIFCIISVVLKCIYFSCGLIYGLRMLHVHLRKLCILLLLGSVCMSAGFNCFIVLFRSFLSYWFCRVLSLLQVALKSPTISVELPISLSNSVNFCFKYFDDLLGT